MPRIHLLPPSVISAIAAGEVAERPAVILKELIENSLDAQATNISIDIHDSGLKSISISDDGHGMTKEDLALSIQRHTTSKITSLSDLEHVASFGFRGEALASIASVAELEITTKSDEDPAGWYLAVQRDEILELRPVGRAKGTTITITELFAAVPARLKFLQHKKTEWQLIAETVSTAALSHPEVGFWLRHNGKVSLSLPANQSLDQRIAAVVGEATAQSLLAINQTHSPVTISGYLGLPQVARRSKRQYLFINRRPITSPSISRSIKHAYSTLLEARVEPFFVLNLELPPGLIDVNVHPRKETVRFIDEKQMLTLLSEIVTTALTQSDTTYTYDPADTTQSRSPLLALADSGVPKNSGLVQRSDRTQSVSTSQVLKQLVAAWQLQPQTGLGILQLHETYLLAQTPDGLLLIDQHAAHERILFEQYKAAYQTEAVKHLQPQILTPPVVLNLSLSETALLEEHLDTFTQLGFLIEPFGTTSFKITQVAQLFADHDLPATIKDMLDDIVDSRPLDAIDRATDRTLAYLACRHAVKAGEFLSSTQRQELVTKLAETPNNTTCPHGRPVSITYSRSDLERLFRRHQ